MMDFPSYLITLMFLGYLAVMLTVVFVSGKDGLHDFLDSSKDLLAFRSVEVIGNFLNGFINVFKDASVSAFHGTAEVAANVFYGINDIFFTWKLACFGTSVFLIEYLVGWIVNPNEMKKITYSCYSELKISSDPLLKAIQAVWKIVSNPWNLLGYTLFIAIIRLNPEYISQKSQKLS